MIDTMDTWEELYIEGEIEENENRDITRRDNKRNIQR